jgi:hypothetical protein
LTRNYSNFQAAASIIGAKESERYFLSAFIFFISAGIASVGVSYMKENVLKGRLLTPIFSHRAYPIIPIVLIISACYKVAIGLKSLFFSPSSDIKREMEEAFKDILSEQDFFQKLPVFGKNDPASKNVSAFIGEYDRVIVLQYWVQTKTDWEHKTIAFALDWDCYMYENENCQISDSLDIETAYLLKELFTKGECNYEPLTRRRVKTFLLRPNT